MPPRWESSFDPSPRDTALLAEVLGALRAQLDEGSAGGEGTEGPSADVQELISAAVAELHRVAPLHRPTAGVAPVLGSGVVHQLLRQGRIPRAVLPDEPEPTVDERL
jgi:hypothetical protein